MNRSLLGFGLLAGTILLSAGDSHAATQRFPNPPIAFNNSWGGVIDNIAPDIYDEWACDQYGRDNNIQTHWEWVMYECHTLTTAYPYMYADEPLQVGDLLFWEKLPGALSFTELLLGGSQPPDPHYKIHTGACAEEGTWGTPPGTCAVVWNQTAAFSIPAMSTCGAIDNFTYNLSYQLTSLPPGESLTSPTRALEVSGQGYAFRGGQREVNNFIAYTNNHPYGQYRYNVGGAVDYSPASVCSEAASTAFDTSSAEARRIYAPSYTEVQGLGQTVYNNSYSLCRYGYTTGGGSLNGWNGIDGLHAGLCISQGGRDGICNSMANSAANAVLNRPASRRGSWQGNVHAGMGTSMTPALFACIASGACQ